MTTIDIKKLQSIIKDTKRIARQYYEITQKPLGVTGEIAEFEAARILNLELTDARTPGHDAVSNSGEKIQIKGRCVDSDRSDGQRVGRIKFDYEWDKVVLVLLDKNFDVLEIHEAKRDKIKEVLDAPGSKARNERGAMSIHKFKKIGVRVYPKATK